MKSRPPSRHSQLSRAIAWADDHSALIEVAFRATGWLLAAAILLLSLIPARTMPMTGAPRGLEHLLVFVAMGLAFGLGHRNRLWMLMPALVIFAGAIELVQLAAPGRHPRLSDFIVDAISTCGGLILALALVRFAEWVRSRARAM
jgi:VanZ family protein